MNRFAPRLSLLLVISLTTGVVLGQDFQTSEESIPNWATPLFWSPAAVVSETGGLEKAGLLDLSGIAGTGGPLSFVAVTPCRIADSRGNGFTGLYGPPALAGGVPRSYPLGGRCGIPSTAGAVSLNITVTNTLGPGFILIHPQGGSQPQVSTLNFVASQTVANAAVVPVGGAGAGITIVAGVSGTDLIIDTNGYYASQSLVNTLNSLTGNVTLGAGTNITITPSGQTLTVAATGGPGGFLPSGSSGQTLRHSGSAWVTNNALTSNGTDVTLTGALAFPDTVRVTGGAFPFLHNSGLSNTFAGRAAGNFTMGGGFNTAFGESAFRNDTSGSNNVAAGFGTLNANTTGNGNTAIGNQALTSNISGSNNTAGGYNALFHNFAGGNTAFGSSALEDNATGFNNTAVGVNAMPNNVSGIRNTAVGETTLANNNGNDNTAVGSAALVANTTGNLNTALGRVALINMTSGSNNTAVGTGAGASLTSGDNNVYIANAGAATESSTIRIGSAAQTSTFIAGISNTVLGGEAGVVVNSAGQLGTVFSSARFKERIRDMGEASSGLLKLRPVTFHYRGQPEESDSIHYGLIAEEVDEVMPELVVHESTGEARTVRYHEMPAILVNELQKQQRRIEKQEELIQALEARLVALEEVSRQR